MDNLSFILVLISVFTHAYWNYLIKSSENKDIFIALAKVSEIAIFAVPAFYFLIVTDFQMLFFLLISVASAITFLNYFFLANAYKHGDFSLLYPVSRSSLIFLPLFAWFFIGESVDATGITAIIFVLTGTIIMHLDSLEKSAIYNIISAICNKGTVYALLAAMAVAGYTLWDKISVAKMEPFLYFYLYTFVIACLYSMYIRYKYSVTEIKNEWNKYKARIIQVGFFNSFTYILILKALTTSKATYVGGLRQLSIVVGAFIGYKILGENFNRPKMIGILIIISGGSLIYFAK